MFRTIIAILCITIGCVFAQTANSAHQAQMQTFGSRLFSHATPAQQPKETASLTHKIYGFVPYWERTYSSPRWDLISRIAYFSATFDAAGNVTGTNYWSSAPVVDSAQAHGVPVDLCVAVFSATTINTIISTPSARANFIHNAIVTMLSRNGSGICIDFEQPSSSYSSHLVTFIAEFHDSLWARDPSLWLSICLPAVDWGTTYLTHSLAPNVNAMFIMGYDYHWRSSPTTGAVDPLDDPSETYDIATSVAHYVTQSGAPEKLILGLPLYGFDWACESAAKGATTTADGIAIFYIDALASAATYGRIFDVASSCPYYVYGSFHQGWYPDTASLAMRYSFAKDAGLLGVGFWALGYDGGDLGFWSGISRAFAAEIPLGIIVDDGDAFFGTIGTFSAGAYADSGWSGDYKWCEPGGATSDIAIYAPPLVESGVYDVYGWWLAGTNRCNNVHMVVLGADSTSIFVTQRGSGASWHHLGTFAFLADGTDTLKILDSGATGGTAVIADAMNFVRIAGIAETLTVDNGDDGYSTTGNWIAGTYSPTLGWDGDYDFCNAGSTIDRARFSPTFSRAGRYAVLVHFLAGGNRCENVPVRIAGITDDTVRISQQGSGADWHLVGYYDFRAGAGSFVELSDSGATGGSVVIADAVCWVFVTALSVVEHSDRNAITHYNLDVYPNPFNSEIHIHTHVGATLEFFDLRGALIDRTITKTGEYTWSPNTVRDTGVYLLRVSSKSGVITRKIFYIK